VDQYSEKKMDDAGGSPGEGGLW